MEKALRDSSLGLPYTNSISSFNIWPYCLCLTNKLIDNSPLCLHRNGNSINTVNWNNDGSILVSAGDSLQIQLWSGSSNHIIGRINTSHSHNIFDAKFVPYTNDSQLVSCAADGRVLLYNINSLSMESETELYSLPSMAVKFQFIPQNPSTLLVTSHNGSVYLIDTRESNSNQLIYNQPRSSCLSVSFDPLTPSVFALSTSNPEVNLYDLRCLSNTPFSFHRGSIIKYCTLDLWNNKDASTSSEYCPTDLIFSSKRELLVNYSSYDVVLYDCNNFNADENGICSNVIQTYSERRNRNTFIKDIRFFCNEKYILTGSDSGELFIWETKSGNLIRKIRADGDIVNAISINPKYPKIAVSGIDPSVKIFESILSSNIDNSQELKRISVNPFSLRQMFTINESKKTLKKVHKLRLEGNEAYKSKNYETAQSMYKQARLYLDYIPPGLKYYSKQEESRKLIHLNLAAVRVILKKWKEVINDCSIVLSIDQNNIKARYRRALSYFKLKYYRECKRDLQCALNLSPNDKQIQNLWNKLNELPKDVKDKKLFEGIFL